MANICISRKKRNYELQTPSLGDAWFTSSVEVKIAKEQASNEVNLFWLRNFGAFIWTVSTHVWFWASSGQQGIYSWSPHRTPEASVLPLAKSIAQVRQVAEVAAIEVTQCAAVLLNGLCQLLLAVLDQRQFSASLKKKDIKTWQRVCHSFPGQWILLTSFISPHVNSGVWVEKKSRVPT